MDLAATMPTELLVHIFSFLSNQYYMDYARITKLMIVNKAFRESVQTWPLFMKSLTINLAQPGAALVRGVRQSPRKTTPVSYGALNVINSSMGRLTHLKLGDVHKASRRHVLDDKHLTAIVRAAPKLATLLIQIGVKVTSKGLGVLNALPNLTTLELPIPSRRMSWPQFHQVTTLKLTGKLKRNICFDILFAHPQPSVANLYLWRVHNISQADLRSLETSFPNAIRLSILSTTVIRQNVSGDCERIREAMFGFTRRLLSMEICKTNLLCGACISIPPLFERAFPRLQSLLLTEGLPPYVKFVECSTCTVKHTKHARVSSRCAKCLETVHPNLKTIGTLISIS